MAVQALGEGALVHGLVSVKIDAYLAHNMLHKDFSMGQLKYIKPKVISSSVSIRSRKFFIYPPSHSPS